MIFGKKKHQAQYSAVADSKAVVNDFRLRSTVIGFESYRTADYRLYYKLEEKVMLPLLDAHLAKLFAGEIDDGNGNTLDSIIIGAAREALSDLACQRCDHTDTLRRLTTSHAADRDDIQRIRDIRKKERDAMQTDYNNICFALEKCEEV